MLSFFNFKNLLLFSGLLLGGIALFSGISAEAATFDFNPAKKEFKEQCKSIVDIRLDPEGKKSNAADIELSYNPQEIEILDSDPSTPGKQIKTGDAYETYFGNEVKDGRIRLAGSSFTSKLTSAKTFAKIEFKSKSGVDSTSFEINYEGEGETLDSNIAEASTSEDLLSGVTNGRYTFTSAPCKSDQKSPKITFQQPQPFATEVPSNTQIQVRITDNQSGINVNTVNFNLNGEQYSTDDSEVSYSGDSLTYAFQLDPNTPIQEDRENFLKVKTEDLAGNSTHREVAFNLPPNVCEPPDPSNTQRDDESNDQTSENSDTDDDNMNHQKEDIDGDGINNKKDPDIDGDGVPNKQDSDMDGDGIPNSQDPEPKQRQASLGVSTDREGLLDQCRQIQYEDKIRYESDKYNVFRDHTNSDQNRFTNPRQLLLAKQLRTNFQTLQFLSLASLGLAVVLGLAWLFRKVRVFLAQKYENEELTQNSGVTLKVRSLHTREQSLFQKTIDNPKTCHFTLYPGSYRVSLEKDYSYEDKVITVPLITNKITWLCYQILLYLPGLVLAGFIFSIFNILLMVSWINILAVVIYPLAFGLRLGWDTLERRQL
jgi:hypothetical protein